MPVERVTLHALNVCGIAACVLGLCFPSNGPVWIVVMTLTGVSDMGGFIQKTAGRNGESKELLRFSGTLYFACGQLATGVARLMGGLLRDVGGMTLVLIFVLVMQVVSGVLGGVYMALLRRRARAEKMQEQARAEAAAARRRTLQNWRTLQNHTLQSRRTIQNRTKTGFAQEAEAMAEQISRAPSPVSYTHLTLPTILLV